MTPSDKPEFVSLMTQALAFYRQDVSPFALDVWWQACRPFDLEQVRTALTSHAMNPDRGQFAPKPADLVRELQGTHGDRALMAWSRVYDAMRHVGAYASIDFGDRAIHAAITDIGGWVALCRSEVDELPFWQKRFCDAFRTHAARGSGDAPQRLVGEHETVNAGLGHETPPLALGDVARQAIGIAP